jgi:energy-coupling factor transporter transmembrane protein EcfT
MDADGEQAREGEPKARIFISYSRKDMAFADRLEAALKARGFEPLIDRTEIYAFEDWWKRIEALIGRADTIVFVLSPDAVTSDVALKEVTHAASLNKRFAPIVMSFSELTLRSDSKIRQSSIAASILSGLVTK